MFRSVKKLLDEDHVAHIFSKLMMAGKVKSALRFITDNSRGGILKLDDQVTVQNEKIQVREILQLKHPASRPACENSLLYGPVDHIDPILFDGTDGSAIRNAALRTTGAAGPSGVDANGWRRLCVSFQTASNDLCIALALDRRICSKLVDPSGIEAFVARRLISLWTSAQEFDLLVLERSTAAL